MAFVLLPPFNPKAAAKKAEMVAKIREMERTMKVVCKKHEYAHLWVEACPYCEE